MRKHRIYIIKNTVNSKVYIGQTINSLKERFGQHKKPCVLKQRGSYKIYNAMNKYGIDKFYIELLEDGIDQSVVDNREMYYINLYDSFEKGYNSTRGGDSKTISRVCDIDKLVTLEKSGVTYKEIASEFGVNVATIVRTCDSLGIKRKNKVTKEFLLENLHKTNLEMGEMLGVHSATITRAFQKYGINRGRGCNNHLNKQNQPRKV